MKTAERTIYGGQHLSETGLVMPAASLTAASSSIKCNNYKGQWSCGSGLFNMSHLSSIINRLITVSAHNRGKSSLKVIDQDQNVNREFKIASLEHALTPV